jgi:predicted DsbA family dithiol-disulfide isomerase
VVERLEREHRVEVEWKPFFLRPDTPPEGLRLSPELRARLASANERLKQMAHTAGLEMVQPEIIPNSRRALEATEFARDRGKHEEFHLVVFRKFYGEGQDINQWTVLRATAEEAGLNPDEMQREVERGKYHDVLDAEIAEAYALGITAVPTYVLNDKYAIVGAQPYEVFQRVLARLSAEDKKDDKVET